MVDLRQRHIFIVLVVVVTTYTQAKESADNIVRVSATVSTRTICCLSSSDVIDCLVNNAGCADVCINTIGSFQCFCSNGYEFERLPEGTIPDLTNVGRACVGK